MICVGYIFMHQLVMMMVTRCQLLFIGKFVVLWSDVQPVKSRSTSSKALLLCDLAYREVTRRKR